MKTSDQYLVVQICTEFRTGQKLTGYVSKQGSIKICVCWSYVWKLLPLSIHCNMDPSIVLKILLFLLCQVLNPSVIPALGDGMPTLYSKSTKLQTAPCVRASAFVKTFFFSAPFISMDFFLSLNLSKWVSALHSVCVLMCVFVCLISLSIRAQPLILRWPSLRSLCVCVFFKWVCLNIVLFSLVLPSPSLSLSLSNCLQVLSPLPLCRPSLPKHPWSDRGGDAGKLQRGRLVIAGGNRGKRCKVQKQVLPLPLSVFVF